MTQSEEYGRTWPDVVRANAFIFYWHAPYATYNLSSYPCALIEQVNNFFKPAVMYLWFQVIKSVQSCTIE